MKLQNMKDTMTAGEIRIKKGIFQGDSISPLLFVLALNPLSCLLNNLQNLYRLNPRGEKKPRLISYLFYMDDLKLFSPNRTETEKQIEIVKRFSEDIEMRFVLDKCAFLTLKKGRRVH